MDDDYLVKSDNIDTPRLYVKVNLRVVSVVSPRDRTVSHLLHNKPITDELMANLKLAEMDLFQFATFILQDSSTHCSPNVRTLLGASSEQWPPSSDSPSKCSRR